MPLVKVVQHGQVVLPPQLREELAIEDGDYLEAEVKDGGLFLRPSAKATDANARKTEGNKREQNPFLLHVRQATERVPSLSQLISEGRESE